MKKIFILFSLIFTNNVFCQDLDELLFSRQIDCSDISYNSGLYYVKYMTENNIDSAKKILHYWETKCGMREPVFRAKILLSLKERNFVDSLLHDKILHNMLNYQERMEMKKKELYYDYDNYKQYYGFIPPGQEFDIYTCGLAEDLKKTYDLESIEYLLAEFYSNDINSDSIFLKIQTKKYEGTVLHSDYYEIINGIINQNKYHFSFFTGTWIPTGNLKLLGVHPEIGFQLGLKSKKINYDITMSFKFINSPNYYYVKRKNFEPQQSKHFFGGNIGLDIGCEIYAKKRHEFQLVAGLAFDNLEVIGEDKDNDIKPLYVYSYDLSVGFAYRYYIKGFTYIGLRAKYHIVDYTLGNIINFTGNPITINVVVGVLRNLFNRNPLKSLNYKIKY
ncbi:MAG: hypothetical protein LBF04_03935 [Prevotellaceae bacterium]|jgi:hypothetical protein|nr:hypothetical protein [Prevotellaceae bacterium]